MESKKVKNKEKHPILDWFCSPKPLIVISFLIIVFSLFAPWLFTTFSSGIAFGEKTGQIGDTFGIMNPIIAIAAAIITFAAFWTQYQANTVMLEENKKERDDSAKLNRKQQLINQFYEMLKIHQDNVKELKWTEKVVYEKNGSDNKAEKKQAVQEEDEHDFITNSGRYIFNYYLKEFNIAYNLVEIQYPNKTHLEKVKLAYDIFYRGYFASSTLRNLIAHVRRAIKESLSYDDFSTKMASFIQKTELKEKQMNILGVLYAAWQNKSFFSIQRLLCGHFEKLNHYYRHLFLMVKTIAKEDEDILSYPEKRDLLRILRAQLSNKEQIMLFYNWFSGHGKQWEEFGNEGNHFFTRFRMIHNMTPYDAIPFQNKDWNADVAIINFIQYFSNQANSAEEFANHPVFNLKYVEKEYPEKTNDPLFEFEDWYDSDDHKFKYEN